jgi:hypothetical protein
MDATIWGPHYWFFLHTMAFHYPVYPTSIQKKMYHRFIHNLYEFIPNKTIATTFQSILKHNPVTPYLDTRKDFIKWMHHIHNKVNLRLDKPTISLAYHYKEYEVYFDPVQSKFRLLKEKRKVIFILTLFFGGLYVYFYTPLFSQQHFTRN